MNLKCTDYIPVTVNTEIVNNIPVLNIDNGRLFLAKDTYNSFKTYTNKEQILNEYESVEYSKVYTSCKDIKTDSNFINTLKINLMKAIVTLPLIDEDKLHMFSIMTVDCLSNMSIITFIGDCVSTFYNNKKDNYVQQAPAFKAPEIPNIEMRKEVK